MMDMEMSTMNSTSAMNVVDDRHMNIIRARRKHRFMSSQHQGRTSNTDNDYNSNNNFKGFNDPLYKKAKSKNLWGSPDLGTDPVKMTCPHCRHAIETDVIFDHTWKSCLVFCCFLAVGLCLIPLAYNLCQDALHFCPICSTFLGHTKWRHNWQYQLPSWIRRSQPPVDCRSSHLC